jgi:integrase
MQEVGRPPRRSKAAVLEALKEALGAVKLSQLNRERLIEFGRKRSKQGAGPAILAIDFSFIRTVATHAAAVHGIEVSAEEVRPARLAMKHLGLVGNSKERDRRPTQDELDELIEYLETNRRQFIPMGRIVRYAVATTMRQEEICRPDWPDVDMQKRLQKATAFGFPGDQTEVRSAIWFDRPSSTRCYGRSLPTKACFRNLSASEFERVMYVVLEAH